MSTWKILKVWSKWCVFERGERKTKHLMQVSLEVCMPGSGWCIWWLRWNCFWFLFFKGNKTLQVHSFLDFFGTVLVILPGFLCSLLVIFAFSVPSHDFLLRFPKVWPWDFGFHSEEVSEILQNLTWLQTLMGRRKIKCFLYAKERCGCSSCYLTEDSPALIASPIPCLSSSLAWNVFRGEPTSFLGVDANLLITSGENSAFCISFSLY